MLSLFFDNRKGAITIMLSFLLIAVLSINSTFLETARYRSLENLYKEIEENAAFSTLSQYDRDLLKNFGLLAMQQKVSKADFMKYLQANLNENQKDGNGADSLLKISAENINFDKIYALSQKEVFQNQVDEFCAYRAPVYLLDDVLNIEEALQSFLKQLESMIPFLDVFKDVANQAQRLVELYIALDEYKESSKTLQEMKNEYENSVKSYNAAVALRDAYLADTADSDEEDDGEGETRDENKVEEYNSEIESKAGEVRNAIQSLKDSLGEFYEKNVSFYGAYDAFLGGNMQVALDTLNQKADNMTDSSQKQSAKQMVTTMKSAYEDSKRTCGKISEAMDKLTEYDILNSQENLTVQYENLAKPGSELGSINVVSMTSGQSLMDIIRLVISTGEVIAETISKAAEALSLLGEAITILKVLGTGATYEPEYNNIVNKNNIGKLQKTKDSSFNEEDRILKDNQIRETNEVAESLDFNTDIFSGSNTVPDNNILQNALESTTSAFDSFLSGIQNLITSKTFIAQTLANLTAAISCVVILIEAIINLASVAANIINGADISQILYQKMSSAVYANSMFSNRTTDVSSDKRLNGSSFDYYSPLYDDGSCFDMANVEYVIGGAASEMVNQKTVFNLMLAVRALCNLPAVLNNDLVMEVVKALGGTGILIPVAIIIFFVVLIIEAYLDMIFVIYTPEGVEFIKTKGYLDITEEINITEYFRELKIVIEEIQTRQNEMSTSIEYNYTEYTYQEHSIEVSSHINYFSDDFKKKFQSMTKHGQKLAGNTGTSNDSGNTKKIDMNKWASDYKDGLTKANYSDHTFLLLALLISNDKIYARCADLVSMQMQQIKRNRGQIEVFDLKDMATCLRIESTAYYTPLMPIPIIPGLNDKGIAIKNVHYSGY